MTTFTTTGADLHEAAAWASRVTPAKPFTPILSGLLLDADEQLTISAYDYETRASVSIAATVTVPGRALVSARLLTAIAKTVARDVNVTLTVDGGRVEVRCGRSEWTLPALPVDEYPTLPKPGGAVGAVNAGELRRALSRILPLVSRDAIAPMLTGVKLEGDETTLTLVGTDRFRLAAATIGWQPTGELPLHALVPGTLLDAAARAITADTETVGVSCDGSGFGIATDTHIVTGRLLDVAFPRWRPIMANPNPEHHAAVDTAELANAVEQALIAAGDEHHLMLEFDTGQVQVSAAGDERRAHAVAEAVLTGPPMAVAFTAGYLRDALTTCGAERVSIDFGASSNKSVLVRPDGDDGYRHTLMPVRRLAPMTGRAA